MKGFFLLAIVILLALFAWFKFIGPRVMGDEDTTKNNFSQDPA
jgi:hypothetical protein